MWTLASSECMSIEEGPESTNEMDKSLLSPRGLYPHRTRFGPLACDPLAFTFITSYPTRFKGEASEIEEKLQYARDRAEAVDVQVDEDTWVRMPPIAAQTRQINSHKDVTDLNLTQRGIWRMRREERAPESEEDGGGSARRGADAPASHELAGVPSYPAPHPDLIPGYGTDPSRAYVFDQVPASRRRPPVACPQRRAVTVPDTSRQNLEHQQALPWVHGTQHTACAAGETSAPMSCSQLVAASTTRRARQLSPSSLSQ
ncbi:hypothetical protein K491DRAFT_684153 [Lophiostoma macrostomum CBS 122681]|uniref:Uncharacterized protein n=1 Tax=Lophiostoma macrostomum CBS 122681 TaxID=1314788 RepID=A0A6A6SS87_9PLEO|nr:hypothetical protein K491DRAFT_684153 [Lophiostoma macrostomum CBS 122681]